MRIWKNIFCGMIVLGFILAIGTAGSSDVGAIGEQELYIRLAVAAGITIVGFVGAYLIERREGIVQSREYGATARIRGATGKKPKRAGVWSCSGKNNERPRQLTTEGALLTEEKSTANGLTHRLHN